MYTGILHFLLHIQNYILKMNLIVVERLEINDMIVYVTVFMEKP